MLPAETDRAARDVELAVALERQAAVDEVVEPAVARLSLDGQVAVGVPVGRDEKIHVVVDHEVVAEVRHVPLVAARGTDDVAQADPRPPNASPPPAAPAPTDHREPPPPAPPADPHRRLPP